MAKKPSLTDALHRAADPEPSSATQRVPAQPTDAPGADVPPSRRGKKVIAGYFDPATSKQMKLLALERNSSVQALLAEALNLLFERHGKPPIA